MCSEIEKEKKHGQIKLILNNQHEHWTCFIMINRLKKQQTIEIYCNVDVQTLFIKIIDVLSVPSIFSTVPHV